MIWPAALSDELEDEESAEAYLENHHNEPGGEILSADTRPWSESPPLPLITSTLQQQASSLFRMNPKDAMRVAQRLYEAGHITYMRTDKAVLSDEAKEQARQHVLKEQVSYRGLRFKKAIWLFHSTFIIYIWLFHLSFIIYHSSLLKFFTKIR
jgi:DNA topoisomerase IA